MLFMPTALLVPSFVAIAGAAIFALSSNGKAAELGKWAFVIGLFWLLSHHISF
jgi:hypothetical protein